jgi:hypothetical protein
MRKASRTEARMVRSAARSWVAAYCARFVMVVWYTHDSQLGLESCVLMGGEGIVPTSVFDT